MVVATDGDAEHRTRITYYRPPPHTLRYHITHTNTRIPNIYYDPFTLHQRCLFCYRNTVGTDGSIINYCGGDQSIISPKPYILYNKLIYIYVRHGRIQVKRVRFPLRYFNMSIA